jgi:pimeloyl-ACP methyl ester carboxylesterase
MDLRGYGGSTKPREMDQPAADNPPIGPAPVAVRDVAAVIEHIRSKRGVPRINLLGWSRGTALIGLYASQNPDRVQRLVFHAPSWFRIAAPAATAPPAIGAYQTWTVAQARERLQAGAPADARDSLMPPRWVETWSAAVLATDPVGAARTPPVVRTPAGNVQDGREYWQTGKELYDPARITAPILIVGAEWDGVTPPATWRALFAKLTNARVRRLVEIGEGTHFLALEKNRHQLFREVRLFLEEPHPIE